MFVVRMIRRQETQRRQETGGSKGLPVRLGRFRRQKTGGSEWARSVDRRTVGREVYETEGPEWAESGRQEARL